MLRYNLLKATLFTFTVNHLEYIVCCFPSVNISPIPVQNVYSKNSFTSSVSTNKLNDSYFLGLANCSWEAKLLLTVRKLPFYALK